jgi:hypothetical protein
LNLIWLARRVYLTWLLGVTWKVEGSFIEMDANKCNINGIVLSLIWLANFSLSLNFWNLLLLDTPYIVNSSAGQISIDRSNPSSPTYPLTGRAGQTGRSGQQKRLALD